MGLPWWFSSKESACGAGELGSVPGMRRSTGKGNGNPLQYLHLGNSLDRGAWQATVHGVTSVGHDLVCVAYQVDRLPERETQTSGCWCYWCPTVTVVCHVQLFGTPWAVAH